MIHVMTVIFAMPSQLIPTPKKFRKRYMLGLWVSWINSNIWRDILYILMATTESLLHQILRILIPVMRRKYSLMISKNLELTSDKQSSPKASPSLKQNNLLSKNCRTCRTKLFICSNLKLMLSTRPGLTLLCFLKNLQMTLCFHPIRYLSV